MKNPKIRWAILLALHNSSPIGALEKIILSIVQSDYPDETPEELRHNFDYLESRGLIKFDVMPHGRPDRRLYELTTDGAAYAKGSPLYETDIARPSPIKRAGRPKAA